MNLGGSDFQDLSFMGKKAGGTKGVSVACRSSCKEKKAVRKYVSVCSACKRETGGIS